MSEIVKISSSTDWRKTTHYINKFAYEFRNSEPILFLSKMSLKDAFEWLYKNITFEPDFEKQTLKTPIAVFNDKKANCVNYSLVLASLLFHTNTPFYYVICGINEIGEHIYIITKNGIKLDATIGQNYDFDNRLLKSKKQNSSYNQEHNNLNYKKYIEAMPALEVKMNGIRSTRAGGKTILPKCSCRNNVPITNNIWDRLRESKAFNVVSKGAVLVSTGVASVVGTPALGAVVGGALSTALGAFNANATPQTTNTGIGGVLSGATIPQNLQTFDPAQQTTLPTTTTTTTAPAKSNKTKYVLMGVGALGVGYLIYKSN